MVLSKIYTIPKSNQPGMIFPMLNKERMKSMKISLIDGKQWPPSLASGWKKIEIIQMAVSKPSPIHEAVADHMRSKNLLRTITLVIKIESRPQRNALGNNHLLDFNERVKLGINRS